MNKTTKWYARPLYAVMALALVAGLTLVPTLVPVASPIVEAAVSNVTVWVDNPTPSEASNYTINFTTTVKLTTAADDTIIVDFPAGTTTNTTISSITAATTWVNGIVASSVTIGGRRVSVKPGANVDAGNITIAFGNSTAPIDNPDPEGNYTLTVYTTQEATGVNSSNYMIDTVIEDVRVSARVNTSVNTATNYTLHANLTTSLVADVDTITITFPKTTTVPETIDSASYVTINGTALYSTANYHGSNTTKTVTVDVHTGCGSGEPGGIVINFANATGFKNPTTIATNWTLIVHTSKDRGLKTSAAYSTTAGNQSVVTQINWSSYDAYVPNNTISDAFNITTQDSYGNNATVDDDITFILGAGDGTFYDAAESGSPITTIDIEDGNSTSADFYYKCTTPGTQYVTAYSGSGPSWTRANQSIIVNPMVQLWGGGVKAAEYTTIQGAADAALPYDTIKVAASTYQEDVTVSTSNVTIESTGGAASTTLIINSSNRIIDVTAANVTIDGLHLQGDNSSGDRGIYMRHGGFTIKNCIINQTANDGIIVESAAGIIDTGTIDNCTITGLGHNSTVYRAGIRMEAYSNNTIRNIIISNNTVSHYGTADNTKDAKGIHLSGGVAGDAKGNVTAKVVNNTITNCRTGLNLRGDLSNGTTQMTGANATANNTISDCYIGVLLHWTLKAEFSLIDNTISNNTAYGIYLAADGTLNSTDKLITHNNIYGNGYAGINNTYSSMTSDLVATYNWWGNASGPGGVGPGTGDNVTGNVTYSPWLNAPYPGGNTTAFSNITLQVNWNFISVPRNLSNATFGFLLSGQNISASYSYGPATGWALLNNSSPVDVLAGYWIDANAAGTINLTFVSTGQEVPASKALTGKKWNAIGFSNITAMTASATLQSVNGSWSTVLGWNATEQSYDASIIYGMNDNTTMTPGKGYWVWMTANDTLAALSA